MGPKRREVHVLAIWRYFIYSVLVGRCSRSLNSPLLHMIQGLFKGPKETRDVSTFLTFQIWIFLCRFPYLEVHYSENCTLHCHQQSGGLYCRPVIPAKLSRALPELCQARVVFRGRSWQVGLAWAQQDWDQPWGLNFTSAEVGPGLRGFHCKLQEN